MNTISRKYYASLALILFLILAAIFVWGSAVPFIRVTFGDFLVVMFLYTGLLTLFPKLSPLISGTIIFLISVTVELLQLGVIQRFFDTSSRVVEATLGSTFDPHDILAYFLGVTLITMLDRFALRRLFSTSEQTK